MATNRENLETALAQVYAQLASITENPKPTYSIDGQSVSWGDHFRSLTEQAKEIRTLMQVEDGPFMLRKTGRQAR